MQSGTDSPKKNEFFPDRTYERKSPQPHNRNPREQDINKRNGNKIFSYCHHSMIRQMQQVFQVQTIGRS